jgi:hypothetical protein
LATSFLVRNISNFHRIFTHLPAGDRGEEN